MVLNACKLEREANLQCLVSVVSVLNGCLYYDIPVFYEHMWTKHVLMFKC